MTPAMIDGGVTERDRDDEPPPTVAAVADGQGTGD